MAEAATLDRQLTREWLVSNGLGGYASGTVSGLLTRRYHGYLVSALPNPHGRTMMLNYLIESLILPDKSEVRLTAEERTSCSLQTHGTCFISDFHLEMGLPVWRYRINETIVEKRLFLRYRQNSVQVSYNLLEGPGPIGLRLSPAVSFRPHNHPIDELLSEYSINIIENQIEIHGDPALPALKILVEADSSAFKMQKKQIEEFVYHVERRRGYPYIESLWTPGALEFLLSPKREVHFIASTESWEVINALSPTEAKEAESERRLLLCQRAPEQFHTGIGADMMLSADQFLIRPPSRWKDMIRTNAAGDSARSVIAGYHWFTDWGRDTMISLEGLTLVTGRYSEAAWILKTFSRYIKQGLIPNLFPEQEEEGRYNTADATLWMFHAVERYFKYSHDWPTVRLLLPKFREIIERHMSGTLFGIGVDSDRLLRQGQEGFALTWMDAKVADLVVTPRRGKAVEINALWYNALKLLAEWSYLERDLKSATLLEDEAKKVKLAFNRRFWNEKEGCLFDVVDGEKGDDKACRPNQIFAISLSNPVLDRRYWESVLKTIKNRLLTPFGLRTLAPNHPDYQKKYSGDVFSRDMAYHQGTVWPWLIGHFIDAWLKVDPQDQTISRLLETLITHFQEQACINSVSEVFDADDPFLPGGCIAQAWSVAELLRSWVKVNALQNQTNPV